MPTGGVSTAQIIVATISASVTSPSRRADSRVQGSASIARYTGFNTTGHLRPGPSTYQGRNIVAFNPAARMVSSPSVRAAMYSRMTGAGCATLTYTKCPMPALCAAETASFAEVRSMLRN